MASSSDEDEIVVDLFFDAPYDRKLELLLKFAAELNCGETLAETFVRVKDSKNLTALHKAAQGGRTRICKYLIQSLKLDVNLEDGGGFTALHHAVGQGQYSTAEFLLNIGANPNVADRENGITPLHFAAKLGRTEFVSLLIEKGADVEVHAARNGTPLHHAACWGRKMHLLLY